MKKKKNTNTRKMKCMRIFYCDKKSQNEKKHLLRMMSFHEREKHIHINQKQKQIESNSNSIYLNSKLKTFCARVHIQFNV